MGLFTKTSGRGWSLDKGSGRLTISGDVYVSDFFKIRSKVRSIVAEKGVRLRHCGCLFEEMENLEKVDLSGVDISECKDLAMMFFKCTNLRTLKLAGWNTSHVTKMLSLFSGCKKLETLDLTGWHVSTGTNTSGMFDDVPQTVNIIANDESVTALVKASRVSSKENKNDHSDAELQAALDYMEQVLSKGKEVSVQVSAVLGDRTSVSELSGTLQADSKPVPAPETCVKEEPKPATKVAIKAEVKKEPKSEAKPAPKAEIKPAMKEEPNPAKKVAHKSEAKTEPKSEAKSAMKAEKKTAVKEEQKPATKAEPKSVPKAESSLEERVNALRDRFRNGDAEDIYQIALCFRDGIGVEKNEFNYLKSLIQADAKGSKDAYKELCGVDADTVYRYGRELHRQERYQDSGAFFIAAGRLGNAHAWFEIGGLYEDGLGVEKDLAKAADCYRIGAERNDPTSQACLAKMLLLGEGVEQDIDQALFWARKANESEVLKGSEFVNELFSEINKQIANRAYKAGVEAYNAANYTEAMRQSQIAAELGHGSAEYNLAIMYMRGQGADKDYTKALFWAKKAKESGQLSPNIRIDDLIGALEIENPKTQVKSDMLTQAEAGDPRAMATLAISYFEGFAGMSQNAVEAFYWASKAKKSGKLDAKGTKLMNLILDTAETVFTDTTYKHLRPEEIKNLFGGLDVETAKSMASVVNFVQEVMAVHKDDIDSETMNVLLKKLPM